MNRRTKSFRRQAVFIPEPFLRRVMLHALERADNPQAMASPTDSRMLVEVDLVSTLLERGE